MRRVTVPLGFSLLMLLLPAPATAQTPPATTNEALVAMAAKAAVVFSGSVVSVTHSDDGGYVDVQFRIENAVRGCPRTGYYVLREWAGLWSGGVERYRVGQHLLMLLHARGPSGFSSPVNGLDGAIPILPGGDAVLTHGTASAPADTGTTPADLVVDLRWVGAETARTVVASQQSRAQAATSTASADREGSAEWVGAVAPMAKAASTAASGVTMTSVLTQLGGGSIGNGPVMKPVVTPNGKTLESH